MENKTTVVRLLHPGDIVEVRWRKQKVPLLRNDEITVATTKGMYSFKNSVRDGLPSYV